MAPIPNPDLAKPADSSTRNIDGNPNSRCSELTEPVRRRFDLLHEMFEAGVDRHPGAVAVVFGNEQWTYRDLDCRANRFAFLLLARGVPRNSNVALLLDRSVDAYAAMLGILKAGHAFVPIDPGYPPQLVEYILKNSAATALVTTSKLAERQDTVGLKVILVDADRAQLEASSSSRLHRDVSAVESKDLCYVIYTSGSTDPPKAVMIEHRNACHLVHAEADIFRVNSADRVYQGFSLSFDASIGEIWLAFQSGATLVAATPEMECAGPDLARLLTDAHVSVLSCVPTLLSMLEKDVPTIRLLILGGEACPRNLVIRWSRPGRRLVNTYGPTEAPVNATFADLSPDRPVTIERAIPGCDIRLCDA